MPYFLLQELEPGFLGQHRQNHILRPVVVGHIPEKTVAQQQRCQQGQKKSAQKNPPVPMTFSSSYEKKEKMSIHRGTGFTFRTM